MMLSIIKVIVATTGLEGPGKSPIISPIKPKIDPTIPATIPAIAPTTTHFSFKSSLFLIIRSF